jgi:hypothetical protein
VYEAFIFLFLSFTTIIELFFGYLVVVLMQARPDHPPVWRFVLAVTALMVVVWAVFWIGTCTDERRAAGYEWKDWKMRTK